ncbi:Hsp20/alpha crystallin family protein [Sutcliffiella rhizosphaerae]|nr:Hsp20/alpha crystallin family protein [Sutcliffiella rhizosphaerae]
MKDDYLKQPDVEKWLSQSMKGKLPLNHQMLNNTDFFAQSFEMLKHAQGKKKRKKSNYDDPKIFETHQDIIVRIPIQSEDILRKLKTSHSCNTVFLDDVDGNGKKQSIPLPCMVKVNSSKAQYKDGILEITLKKETNIPVTKLPIERIDKNKRKNKEG